MEGVSHNNQYTIMQSTGFQRQSGPFIRIASGQVDE